MAGPTSNPSSNPLTNLRDTIRAHWLEHRPRMCAELQERGTLDAMIESAARNTEEAVLDLTARGLGLWEAWLEVREEWAILPPEEPEPEEEPEELVEVEPEEYSGPWDGYEGEIIESDTRPDRPDDDDGEDGDDDEPEVGDAGGEVVA